MKANDAKRQHGWQDPGAAGPLMTEGDGGQSLPLAWLPDVLRHCAKTLPDKVAAQLIAQKLKARNGLALFELQPGDWARRVTDERIWIAGKPAHAAGFVYGRSNGRQQIPVRWAVSSETTRSRTWRDATPERPEVRGPAGAVSLMVERALIGNPVDQLIRNPVFRLAILATDAAELFGYLASGAEQARPVAPVMRLVRLGPAPDAEGAPVDDMAQHAHELPATAAQPVWKDGRGHWLPETLQIWRNLRNSGMSDAKIAARYGVTRTVITGKLKSRQANKVESQGHKVSSKAAG